MKALLALGLLSAAVCSTVLHAQTREEVAALVKQDMVRWDAVATETVAFHTPPASWEQWRDEVQGISISFPCHPQRTEEENGHTIIVSCQSGGARYALSLTHKVALSASAMGLAATYLGVQYGLTHSMEKKQGPATVTPQRNVRYSAFSGRDLLVSAGSYDMPARLLAVGDNLVQLLAFGPKGTVSQAGNAFFDSLVVDQKK